MKLDEAFEKYCDLCEMSRISKPHFVSDIQWLKGLKVWRNEESKSLGFIIPQFMIDDANADDWQLVGKCNYCENRHKI